MDLDRGSFHGPTGRGPQRHCNMRGFSILTVVAAYVSVCMGQASTGVRIGLLGPELGLDPVPGVSGQGRLQGRPGQSSNLVQQFPSNSGGGIFTQPNNFNPVGSNPGGNSLNGGCSCQPANQRCPPNTSPRESTGIRIANNGGNACPRDQRFCCSSGGRPSPVVGPAPIGPIIPPRSQPSCGFAGVQSNANSIQAGFGEFPWMIVITDSNNLYIGGGALISSNVVLTAAHKINIYRRSPTSLRIRAGDHDISKVQDNPKYSHEERTVQRIIIHPNYDDKNLQNDVALLILSQPINHNQNQFPHIGTVCLPEQGQLFSPQRCLVSGWGEDVFGSNNFQSILKKVDVPIWDHFVCQEKLRNQSRLGEKFILDKTSFLCAGGEAGKDACTGDGGAPLVCQGSNGRFAVVGLVAWGLGCAQRDVPGVYVNVASYVNDFIKPNAGL